MAIAGRYQEFQALCKPWTIAYEGNPRETIGSIGRAGTGDLQFKVNQVALFSFPIVAVDEAPEFNKILSRIALLDPADVKILIEDLFKKKPIYERDIGPLPRLKIKNDEIMDLGLNSANPLVKNHFYLCQVQDRLEKLKRDITYYDQDVTSYFKSRDHYQSHPMTEQQKSEDQAIFQEFFDSKKPPESLWDAMVRALAYKDHPNHADVVYAAKGRILFLEHCLLKQIVEYAVGRGDIPAYLEDEYGLNEVRRYPQGSTRESLLSDKLKKEWQQIESFTQEMVQKLEPADREYFQKEITEEKSKIHSLLNPR